MQQCMGVRAYHCRNPPSLFSDRKITENEEDYMSAKDDKIKALFTAYLNVALKREREDYIKSKMKADIPVDMEVAGLEKQVEFEQNYEKFIFKELTGVPDIRKAGWKNILDGYGAELQKAVSCLEEPERMVMFLKVYFELTYKEIGELMGMSERKAASVYHYARKKLKRRMEKKYGI